MIFRNSSYLNMCYEEKRSVSAHNLGNLEV